MSTTRDDINRADERRAGIQLAGDELRQLATELRAGLADRLRKECARCATDELETVIDALEKCANFSVLACSFEEEVENECAPRPVFSSDF